MALIYCHFARHLQLEQVWVIACLFYPFGDYFKLIIGHKSCSLSHLQSANSEANSAAVVVMKMKTLERKNQVKVSSQLLEVRNDKETNQSFFVKELTCADIRMGLPLKRMIVLLLLLRHLR